MKHSSLLSSPLPLFSMYQTTEGVIPIPKRLVRVDSKLLPAFKFYADISEEKDEVYEDSVHLIPNLKVLYSLYFMVMLNAADFTRGIFMAIKSTSIGKLFPYCAELLLLSLFYFVHSAGM